MCLFLQNANKKQRIQHRIYSMDEDILYRVVNFFIFYLLSLISFFHLLLNSFIFNLPLTYHHLGASIGGENNRFLESIASNTAISSWDRWISTDSKFSTKWFRLDALGIGITLCEIIHANAIWLGDLLYFFARVSNMGNESTFPRANGE